MVAQQEQALPLHCPYCEYRLDAIQHGVAAHPELGKTVRRSGPPPFDWGRLLCPECGHKLYLMRYIGSKHWGFAPVSHTERARRDTLRRGIRRTIVILLIALAFWFVLALLGAFLSLVF